MPLALDRCRCGKVVSFTTLPLGSGPFNQEKEGEEMADRTIINVDYARRFQTSGLFLDLQTEGKVMTEITTEMTGVEITELRSAAAKDNRFYRYFENKVLVGILDALTAARREGARLSKEGERLSKENEVLAADLTHAHAQIEELEDDAGETPISQA
jgi:hypothetical protein